MFVRERVNALACMCVLCKYVDTHAVSRIFLSNHSPVMTERIFETLAKSPQDLIFCCSSQARLQYADRAVLLFFPAWTQTDIIPAQPTDFHLLLLLQTQLLYVG